MSLVNDVLRQLDSDTSKPYPNMPLQSAGQSKTAINWSRFLFGAAAIRDRKSVV